MTKQPLREKKEWCEHLCFGFLAVTGSGLFHSLFEGREQSLVIDLFYVVLKN